MSGDNITAIVKSPAFTMMVATVCVIVIINQMPVLITTIREMKKKD